MRLLRFAAFSVFLTAIAPAIAAAHPAVAVVMDSRGNVYYSDLSNVWRISPDGRKSVVVPHVHTHELYLDAEDNLYGEHLWYEGEKIDKWGHRVWKRAPDGRISVVIPPTEGFLTNYSFIRDRDGTMYWAERGAKTEIRKKASDGRIVVHSRGPFRDIRWMISDGDGVLYLIDDGNLVRVDRDGSVHTMAAGLASRSLKQFNVGPQHALMGLWLDGSRNVYVANYGAGVVKKITPGGAVTTAAKSRFPWSPAGGMTAKNGDLWILEANITNAMRVRRISRDGAVKVF
jgi:sugar lactone lactonase YvrE